jgi:RNA polymerase sigma-70 factor (ECF subfamily)
VTRREWLAGEFERHRSHLLAVAYRMLGSATDAEDAVQEAWTRLDRRDPGGNDDLKGWLTVVVGRISLDMLRSRRARLEDYAGSWLPEPILTGGPGADPGADAIMADSVGLALLVVLETLSPAERLAFVLHDVFGLPYREIAPVVDATPVAARQLASRARQRVRERAPQPDEDLAVQARVVDGFLRAARGGDFDALIRILDPDVVFRFDGGGAGPLARPPLVGAERVAREILSTGAPFAPRAERVTVNGVPGAMVRLAGRPRYVIGFTVAGERIVAIDLNGDPAKVARLSRSGGLP